MKYSENILRGVMIISLCGAFYCAGWLANDYVEYSNYERELNGFYMENREYNSTQNYIDKKDPRGDWVCVNVRGMSYEDGVRTCNHEMGHEIFAEFCENNIDKCINLTYG